MVNYDTVYNLSRSQALRNRLTVAVARAAQDVLNEDPNTPNHAARVRWAHDALRDPDAAAARMMWGLVGNAAVQTQGDTTPDADIQWVCNGLINTFANGVA